MRAGFAGVTITPPIGIAMEGLGQAGGCTRILDDLFIRALYLQDEQHAALLVSSDLLFFERDFANRLKEMLRRQMNLSPEQILLNTTHNHAGPRMTRWAYSGAPDPEYLDLIEARLSQAAREARAKAGEVSIEAGMGRSRLPVSRRRPNKNGKIEWAPWHAGAICDALPICLLKGPDGRIVSLLFSVACHPSIWYETQITSEYPGVAVRELNRHFNTEGAMFLQGAGGDSKPCVIAEDDRCWRHGTITDIENAGRQVAAEVIGCVEEGLARITPELRYELHEMRWLLQAPPAQSYFQKLVDAADIPAQRRSWAADMLRALNRGGELPKAVPIQLHCLQLGAGLRLIGLEGEPVAELGNLILSRFPEGITFPLGYTNGAQIYLVVSHMLAEGSYEVDSYWEYHWPAPLAPGMEKILTDALATVPRWF